MMENGKTSAAQVTITAEEPETSKDEKASKACATETGGEQSGRHSDKRCRKRPGESFADYNKPDELLLKAVLINGLRRGDPQAKQEFCDLMRPRIHSMAREGLHGRQLDILSQDDLEQEMMIEIYEKFAFEPIRSLSGTKAFVNDTLRGIRSNLLKRHYLRQKTNQAWDPAYDSPAAQYVDESLRQGGDEATVILNADTMCGDLSTCEAQDEDMERFTIHYYFERVLKKVDEETAFILIAKGKQGLTNNDLSKLRGWSRNTCKRKCQRAYAKLKREFEKYGWREEHPHE